MTASNDHVTTTIATPAVLLAGMLGLAACRPPVMIPRSADLDSPPILTLSYQKVIDSTGTPTPFITTTQSGPLNIASTDVYAKFTIRAAATNAKGGVKQLSMSFSQNLTPFRVYRATQAPGANGTVNDTLLLFGTDGNGGPGPTPIVVGSGNPLVTITLEAENFNHQTSKLTAYLNVLPTAPRIISFDAKPNYVNVHDDVALSWQVDCGIGEAGCTVTLNGADGPGLAHTVYRETGLPFADTRHIQPLQTAQYTLTVDNHVTPPVSRAIPVTVYQPPPTPNLSPFYFRSDCPVTINPCTTHLQYGTDAADAERRLKVFFNNCTLTRIDAQAYLDGCNP